jgi:hypothetical protein
VIAACGGAGSSGDDGDDDDHAVPDAADPAPDARRPDARAPDATGGSVTFAAHTIDGDADGPAYVAVGNLDGDAALEVVVSHLGKAGFPPTGSLRIYDRGIDLDDWTSATIDDVRFPGQPTLADVDADADLDVILPSGFLVCAIAGQPCGALGWYEHDGDAWVRHDLIEGSASFYHHVVVIDLDGDGRDDLVTGAEQKAFPTGTDQATLQWLAGTDGEDRFATTPQTIASGGGSFPEVLDVDGDGDLDVSSAEFFVSGGSFAWFERDGDTWTRHAIDGDSGPSMMLRAVDDLYGDGVRRWVGSNHSNTAKQPPDPWPSAVTVFTPGADLDATWAKVTISEGIVSRAGSGFAPMAAPGIFGTGDLDDDGDVDVLVSGDGDARVLWLEQTAPGTFATHTLAEPMGQAGGVTIVDLDGDGAHEAIVTAYEEDLVRVYTHD